MLYINLHAENKYINSKHLFRVSIFMLLFLSLELSTLRVAIWFQFPCGTKTYNLRLHKELNLNLLKNRYSSKYFTTISNVFRFLTFSITEIYKGNFRIIKDYFLIPTISLLLGKKNIFLYIFQT